MKQLILDAWDRLRHVVQQSLPTNEKPVHDVLIGFAKYEVFEKSLQNATVVPLPLPLQTHNEP